MTKIIFNVISDSSGQPYELEAERTDNGLRFTCDCPAGNMGNMCKHRQALIDGDFPKIPEPNPQDVATFTNWVQASRIGALLDSIAMIENEAKAAKKRIAAIKHELGRRLHDGVA